MNSNYVLGNYQKPEKKHELPMKKQNIKHPYRESKATSQPATIPLRDLVCPTASTNWNS